MRTVVRQQQGVITPPTSIVSQKAVAVAAYNRDNPNDMWCPEATCFNSPVCQSCKRRFLIEIATGRSGSTSLMHMLEMLPGVRMGGENKNQLYAIRKMFDNFPRRYGKVARGPWQHEYVGRGDLACPAQHIMEAFIPPPRKDQGLDDSNTIIGFKTIRFLDNDDDDKTAVEFVKKYFPCSRVVVNLRSNVTKQSKSNFHFYNENATQELTEMNKRLQRVALLFGHQAYLLYYEEWTDKVHGHEKINDLVHWLGFQHCTFNQLIHDNKINDETDTKQIQLSPQCKYVGMASASPSKKMQETVELFAANSSKYTVSEKFNTTGFSVYFLALDPEIGPVDKVWWSHNDLEHDILNVPLFASECKAAGKQVAANIVAQQSDGRSVWQMSAARTASNLTYALVLQLGNASHNPWLTDPVIQGCKFESAEPIVVEARRWHEPNADALLGELNLSFTVFTTEDSQ